jgi:hypothetical protein
MYYFLFYMPFSIFLPSPRFLLLRRMGSLISAMLIAFYIWRSTALSKGESPLATRPENLPGGSKGTGSGNARPLGLGGCVILGALLTGVVGFSAGFFGPIILSPDSNQGPLLGIFFTGPLGFVMGAIGGWIYWVVRSRR